MLSALFLLALLLAGSFLLYLWKSSLLREMEKKIHLRNLIILPLPFAFRHTHTCPSSSTRWGSHLTKAMPLSVPGRSVGALMKAGLATQVRGNPAEYPCSLEGFTWACCCAHTFSLARATPPLPGTEDYGW